MAVEDLIADYRVVVGVKITPVTYCIYKTIYGGPIMTPFITGIGTHLVRYVSIDEIHLCKLTNDSAGKFQPFEDVSSMKNGHLPACHVSFRKGMVSDKTLVFQSYQN